MPAAYTPCPGSGRYASAVRLMSAAGLGSKLSHLHGKNAGTCPACGRTATLGRGKLTMPRHKAAADPQD
jgi:hypothetical protein